MENKAQILNLIYSRFPNHREYITELFNESVSFQSLCEDYFDCRAVLDESIKINNKTSDLRKEYQEILSEIEDELLERITI
jgi:hypothetical protein